MSQREGIKFNEDLMASMILKHLLGGTTLCSNGSITNQPKHSDIVVDLTDSLQSFTSSAPILEEFDPAVVALIIEDNVQYKWEKIATRVATFLIDLNDFIKKVRNGSGSLSEMLTMVATLKVMKNIKTTSERSVKTRIFSRWTDVTIHDGWSDFLHQIYLCCVPTLKKSANDREVLMFFFKTVATAVRKHVLLGIELTEIPFKDEYGFSSFVGDFQFRDMDLFNNLLCAIKERSMSQMLISTIGLENVPCVPSMGPKKSNNAEQSATIIEVLENTTLSDNSQGNNCDERKLENPKSNEIDKIAPASYSEDANDALNTQEENPVTNEDSTDCMESIRKSNCVGELDDMENFNDNPSLEDLHCTIEDYIKQNWVTGAVGSNASFLIDIHNMIGKSNAGLLDESSATVLHQIIEALKLVKISKADRHELSLEQSIYQEWNLRKIFSGWRKFLLKMWKSATPMEDRNNPRSLVVPDGMKPSVYLAAAKKYFSACIIKHIFHNVEITYKYPNRHDHKAVIIQYSIKHILHILNYIIQTAFNNWKKQCSVKRDHDKSMPNNKQSGNCVSNGGPLKHRLLELSQFKEGSSSRPEIERGDAAVIDLQSLSDGDIDDISDDQDDGQDPVISRKRPLQDH